MKAQVFIHAKDIANIEDCSIVTARLRYKIIQDSLGKQSHQRITVREYCEYNGVKPEDIGITIRK